MTDTSTQQPGFTSLTDLAAERIGGRCLACSDDFFASMHNLIKPGRGIFIADKYTENGKWMDGWESRRKRVPGHDWCVLELGAPGVIRGFDIDTNHFLGNHPPHASVEGLCLDRPIAESDFSGDSWVEILPKSPLNPGSQHLFEIDNSERWTHLRLNIYPDGGVARFRVFGEPYVDWSAIDRNQELDLASAVNGARAVLCNDMFFSHMNNLLMPGRGINMGDGWETKRNRTPNNVDWVIVQLAHKGFVNKLIVDTAHFKGNYPDRCAVEGAVLPTGTDCATASIDWQPVLPQQKLEADAIHEFSNEIVHSGPWTHLRLNIYPDGGVSRLRAMGTIAE